MTQNQLNQRIKLWQSRLGLQDWVITAKFVKEGFSFETEGTLGGCSVHSHKRKAWIEVLHPDHRNEETDPIEETIVHELLHVMLPCDDLQLGHDQKSGPFVVYERGVDQLARSLVRAYNE